MPLNVWRDSVERMQCDGDTTLKSFQSAHFVVILKFRKIGRRLFGDICKFTLYDEYVQHM